jgi:hypothetical protein
MQGLGRWKWVGAAGLGAGGAACSEPEGMTQVTVRQVRIRMKLQILVEALTIGN